jgi:hypothetical protein
MDVSSLQREQVPVCAQSLETLSNAYLTWSHFFSVEHEFLCSFTVNGYHHAAFVATHPEQELIYRSAGIREHAGALYIEKEKLDTAIKISEPVMFGTADEPHNWGLWLLKSLPAAVHFVRNRGKFAKFFCYAVHPNMRAMLRTIGIQDDELILHDPLKSYHLEEVTLFRQSWRDLAIAPEDKEVYRSLGVFASTVAPTGHERIFISRLNRSQANGMMRGLTNEGELADALKDRGFAIVEPERLTPLEQISAFASAREIVGLGGAGMFNAVFCKPGTKLLDIESTGLFLDAHARIFASMDLDYGLLIGEEDPTDPRPGHKSWHLALNKALPIVDQFFNLPLCSAYGASSTLI